MDWMWVDVIYFLELFMTFKQGYQYYGKYFLREKLYVLDIFAAFRLSANYYFISYFKR